MQALSKIRILEPGQLIAGPFAGTLLGDFGAEVIKTELPGRGDPARKLPPYTGEGESIWWKTVARNKKSVTLDLRKPAGQALFRELVKHVDVVIENFRPGVMEGWGLGWDVLHAINPRLIMARQSGFGQDGPYANRPAYGMIVESYSGMTEANRYAESPPAITGISDHIAGLFVAQAILTALYHRDVNGGEGQMIDNAAAETSLRIAGEPHLTAAAMGARSGRTPSSQYPSWPEGVLAMPGVYPTRDGKFVALHTGTAGTSIWKNFCEGIGRPDILDDAPYPPGSPERIARGRAVERDVRDWFLARDRDDIVAFADRHDVTIAPIQDMADVTKDPQFIHRGAMIAVEDDEMGMLTMVRPTPLLSATPGEVRHAGPKVGEHNGEIYKGWLGLDDERLAELQQEGII